MSETVRDIPGKGFKFEQRFAVEEITRSYRGLIGALIGGGHWGPVGQPTFINEGFGRMFGTPLCPADNANDYSGMTATKFLKHSQRLWFTRIADGTEAKASLNLTKSAQPAIIESSIGLNGKSWALVNNKDLVINVNGTEKTINIEKCDDISISFNIDDAGTFTDLLVDFEIDGNVFNFFLSDAVADLDELITELKNKASNINYQDQIIKDTATTVDLLSAEGLNTAVEGMVNGEDATPAWLTIADDGGTIVGTDVPAIPTGDYDFNFKVNEDNNLVSVSLVDTDDWNTIIGKLDAAFALGTVALVDEKIKFTLTNAGNNTLSIDDTEIINPYLVDAFDAEFAGTNVQVADSGSNATPAYIELTESFVSGNSPAISGRFSLIVDGANNTHTINTEDTYLQIAQKYGATIVDDKIRFTSEAVGAGSLIDVSAGSAVDETVGVTFKSKLVGNQAHVRINSIPGFVKKGIDAPVEISGRNRNINYVVDKINTTLTDAQSFIRADGKMVIQSKQNGAAETLEIVSGWSDVSFDLGFANGVSGIGENAITGLGSFKAKYSGRDGNTIKIAKVQTSVGHMLVVYFRGNPIGSFPNYSYDPTNRNYIGTLLLENERTKDVVEFIPPTGPVTPFGFGEYMLTGGKSGIEDLQDYLYHDAIMQYKNLDLYNVDLIGVSGNSSETIANSLQELCEYRQDCFSIIDPPEDVAGVVAGVRAPWLMIDWHKGHDDNRTEQLDSMYMATYFPFVGMTTPTTFFPANIKQWYAPSTVVIPAIAQAHAVNQVAAPAGHQRTKLDDVEELAFYLSGEDKARLYGDEFDNSINPIVYNQNLGFFIDGQKNTDRTFGAISRLNVLFVSLGLKRDIEDLAPDFFWRPLNTSTIQAFNDALKGICEKYVKLGGMKENYTINTGEELNSEEVEASRGLIGAVEWESVRSIEKIKVISTLREKRFNVTFQ